MNQLYTRITFLQTLRTHLKLFSYQLKSPLTKIRVLGRIAMLSRLPSCFNMIVYAWKSSSLYSRGLEYLLSVLPVENIKTKQDMIPALKLLSVLRGRQINKTNPSPVALAQIFGLRVQTGNSVIDGCMTRQRDLFDYLTSSV